MAGKNANSQLDAFLSTSRGKSYTVAAVTAGLVLIIIVAGIIPAVSSISEKIAENQERIIAIEKVEDKIKTLKTLDEELDSKRDIEVALNYFFPRGEAQEVIYNQIDRVMLDSGVRVDRISFSPANDRRSIAREFKVSTAVESVQINIDVRGTRTQIVSFLGGIESSRRIINTFSVTEFRVDEQNPDLHRAQIKAEAYYWLDSPNE